MRRERLQKIVPYALVALALVAVVLYRAGAWEPVENLLAAITSPVQQRAKNLLNFYAR